MPNSWDQIIHGLLNDRKQKPRSTGITMIIDTGMGIGLTKDILEYANGLIDHWKLSFGTSVFVPEKYLRSKLDLLADHNILTYPGGTLLEVALVEHHCRVFTQHARKLGFTAVEISDGTIPLPQFRRTRIIQCALDAGLTPITEVGKKDPGNQISAKEMADQALSDLEDGARWVVVEGRESGKNVGIFDADGKVNHDSVNSIQQTMSNNVENLIWEAPLKEQQAFLIKRFGSNVSLGNINALNVLAVEALRAGLRYETLGEVTSRLLSKGSWDPNEIELPRN